MQLFRTRSASGLLLAGIAYGGVFRALRGSPTFAAWWFQSLSFSQGTPIPVSNRQETLVTP